jgi:hypothetical protein
VDFAQLKGWLSNCEANHGEDCNLWAYASARYRLPIEIVLIDVVNNCLVEAESDWRYLALSYVWGSVNMLSTVEANFTDLKKRGSLGPGTSLPIVIQDAIELVRKLGEQYLWVDQLCIKQDSRGKHQELARMDIIYSHALLTVAAVDAKDANNSLPGVRPRSRVPVQRVESVQDMLLISEPPPLQRFLRSCVYESRGWTFQERVFSKRILFVSEQQMYFQCQNSIRSESHPHEQPPWSIRERINKIRLRGSWKIDILNFNSSQGEIPQQYWLDGLPVYQDLVEAYSSRKLSFAADAVNAFAGFNSVFEECCGGPLVSAMPTAALSSALLWIGSKGIQRRKADGANLFSSWSWVGWEGSVKYPNLMRLGSSKSSPTLYSRLENVRVYTKDLSGAVQPFQDASTTNSDLIVVEQRLNHHEFIPLVDLLTFTAPTLDFDDFELLEAKSKPIGITSCTLISRREETVCGAIFGVSDVDFISSHSGSLELVLLSHDFSSTSRAQLRASYGASNPPKLSGKSNATLHTLNLLLVRNQGEYYERIAVGKMYSECWSSFRQTAHQKEIILA